MSTKIRSTEKGVKSAVACSAGSAVKSGYSACYPKTAKPLKINEKEMIEQEKLKAGSVQISYMEKPSIGTRRRVQGKEYRIRSYFTDGRSLADVYTEIALRRAYDDFGNTNNKGKKNRFGSGGENK